MGSLVLVKAAAPLTYSTVGDVISYTYQLTNNTGITLYPPYSIDDDKTLNEACPAEPASLAPGNSVSCSASYTITQGDIGVGSVTNMATGAAFDAAVGGIQVLSNQDSETVTYMEPQQDLIFSDGFENLP